MSDAITLNGHARVAASPLKCPKKRHVVPVRFDAAGRAALVARRDADAPGTDLAVYARVSSSRRPSPGRPRPTAGGRRSSCCCWRCARTWRRPSRPPPCTPRSCSGRAADVHPQRKSPDGLLSTARTRIAAGRPAVGTGRLSPFHRWLGDAPLKALFPDPAVGGGTVMGPVDDPQPGAGRGGCGTAPGCWTGRRSPTAWGVGLHQELRLLGRGVRELPVAGPRAAGAGPGAGRDGSSCRSSSGC